MESFSVSVGIEVDMSSLFNKINDVEGYWLLQYQSRYLPR
jgi:hypothetical protein